MKRLFMTTAAFTLLSLAGESTLADHPDGRAAGPLRIHPDNPRYFTDGSGRAILLVGDPYDDPALAPILAGQGVGVRDAEPPRRAMGHARTYATRMDLAASRPAGELSSTGYCLAVPGREYLVYLPAGGAATVDLSAAKGKLSVEWTHPITGKVTPAEAVEGGRRQTLKAPFAGDAVLFVHRVP